MFQANCELLLFKIIFYNSGGWFSKERCESSYVEPHSWKMFLVLSMKCWIVPPLQGSGAGEDACDRKDLLGSNQRRGNRGAHQGQPTSQSQAGRAAGAPAACQPGTWQWQIRVTWGSSWPLNSFLHRLLCIWALFCTRLFSVGLLTVKQQWVSTWVILWRFWWNRWWWHTEVGVWL